MTNKLTILMPSYNRGQYISEAVDSILNQKTNFGIKLIITDDCSTDGSVEIIKALQEKYSEKIEALFSDENKGLLTNILKAQVKVNTEYFCVLDPDDYYIDENFLQKAIDYLEAQKDFTIYSSNCRMLYEDAKTEPFIKSKRKNAIFNFDDLLNENLIITQTAGSIFRNVIYKNGIPKIIQQAIGTESEPSFRADTERYIMHLNKGKAYFNNEIVAIYRIHKSGIWTKTNQFHRNLLSAQGFYDYFRYFEYKYPEYFIKQSNFYIKLCFDELKKAIDENKINQTVQIDDLKHLFDLMLKNEKYHVKDIRLNNKKKKITCKKILKALLPYGLVKIIQKIR